MSRYNSIKAIQHNHDWVKLIHDAVLLQLQHVQDFNSIVFPWIVKWIDASYDGADENDDKGGSV